MSTIGKLASLLHSEKFYFIIAIFAVAAIIPLIAGAFLIDVITLIMIFAIYASSWNLLANSGQGSLGHAVFLGMGGFASALVAISFKMSPIVSLFVGGMLSAGIGLLIGLTCVRLKVWFLAMVTFGFSVIAESLFSQFDYITHGINGLSTYNLFPRGFPFYFLALSFAVVSICIMFLIMRSRIGFAFKAIHENEMEAKMMGINTSKYKLLAFVISTFFAGIAGGLFAYSRGSIANSVFSPEYSFMPLIMSVIGGLGTIEGPIIGSIILEFVQDVLKPIVTDFLNNSLGRFFPGVGNAGPLLTALFIGVFLIVIVIFLPKGVISLIRRFYNYLLSP